MTTPEFSRPFRAHDVGGLVRQQVIEADPFECDALAARFNLVSLESLTAAIELKRDAAGIRVTGQVHAVGEQACVATAEPVPFLITEKINVLLIENAPDGEDVELADADLDAEALEGDIIDMGEIAAQAFALALDPYPRSTLPAPGVITEEAARAESSPFAVLKKK
jgi:uncharacterized metal-binding protein YceD (DUF177 family)